MLLDQPLPNSGSEVEYTTDEGIHRFKVKANLGIYSESWPHLFCLQKCVTLPIQACLAKCEMGCVSSTKAYANHTVPVFTHIWVPIPFFWPAMLLGYVEPHVIASDSPSLLQLQVSGINNIH